MQTRRSLAGVYVIYGKNSEHPVTKTAIIASAPHPENFQYFSIDQEEPVVRPSDKQRRRIIPDIAMQMTMREIDQIVVSADKIEKRVAELSVSMNVIKPHSFQTTILPIPGNNKQNFRYRGPRRPGFGKRRKRIQLRSRKQGSCPY